MLMTKLRLETIQPYMKSLANNVFLKVDRPQQYTATRPVPALKANFKLWHASTIISSSTLKSPYHCHVYSMKKK